MPAKGKRAVDIRGKSARREQLKCGPSLSSPSPPSLPPPLPLRSSAAFSMFQHGLTSCSFCVVSASKRILEGSHGTGRLEDEAILTPEAAQTAGAKAPVKASRGKAIKRKACGASA